MIDELPADLSEQVFMQQRDMGVELEEEWKQEWGCSGWRPGLGEGQEEQVEWAGEPWEQPSEEEKFAPGVEAKLLGEGGSSMRGDARWKQKLSSGVREGRWGVLDVYSDGGADGAGTPEATAEYGWLIGGTSEDALEIWAEGAARVGGLPEEMDSTRAELMGAYAVLHKVQGWGGTVRIWIDNDNVVRGLEKRLGIERADAVWAVSESWAPTADAGSDDWRVQMGESADGDLWEAMELLLEKMVGKVEVRWVRGHADKRTGRRMMSR